MSADKTTQAPRIAVATSQINSQGLRLLANDLHLGDLGGIWQPVVVEDLFTGTTNVGQKVTDVMRDTMAHFGHSTSGKALVLFAGISGTDQETHLDMIKHAILGTGIQLPIVGIWHRGEVTTPHANADQFVLMRLATWPEGVQQAAIEHWLAKDHNWFTTGQVAQGISRLVAQKKIITVNTKSPSTTWRLNL
jgi:hypothetical protein